MGDALWLPDTLRDHGLPVRAVPGWETRGMPGLRPRGVVCHHTGATGPGTAPSLRIVTNGRPDLRNALCNVHLALDGVPTVVAARLAWHAGKGGYRGLTGNASVLGVEAEGTTGVAMPDAETEAYERLVAALVDGLRRHDHIADPLVCAHHEWRAEKPDAWALLHGPGGMDGFRYRVAHITAHPPQEDDMPLTDADLMKIAAAIEEGPTGQRLAAVETKVAGLTAPKGPISEIRRNLRRVLVKAGVPLANIEGGDPDARKP